MTAGLKIKEVADASGFTTATLRYYEQIGLLPESIAHSGRLPDLRPAHVGPARVHRSRQAARLQPGRDRRPDHGVGRRPVRPHPRSATPDSWRARSLPLRIRSQSWRRSRQSCNTLPPRSSVTDPTVRVTRRAAASAMPTTPSQSPRRSTPSASPPKPAAAGEPAIACTLSAGSMNGRIGGLAGAARSRRAPRARSTVVSDRVFAAVGPDRRVDAAGRSRAGLLPVLPVRDHRRYPRCRARGACSRGRTA